MLLEFKVKNFKAFKEEAIFSMIPTKVKDLENSILKKAADGKEYKALPTSIVYGANGTGKTNIIEAMEDFREIILAGNILNKEPSHFTNASHANLELIPNVYSKNDEETAFSISFINNSKVFKYGLSARFGKFIDKNYKRTITKEQLFIDDKELFYRDINNGIKLNFKDIKEFISTDFNEQKLDFTLKILKNNLQKTELFLTSGFKSLFSPDLVKYIKKWITYNFIVICSADKFKFVPNMTDADADNKTIICTKLFDKALKQLGTISTIGHTYDKDTKEVKLVSIVPYENDTIVIPSSIFESLGTIRIANLLPIVANVIYNGKTLIIDEFDASVHPMIIMNIIKIFHDEEINKNGAQLIFNTHNPIFLNNSLFAEPLFRRDEIKFVDKDEDKKTSVLYSLSDFGTNSDTPVRSTTDYMKNYFISKYGAIKDIDLSDIFRDGDKNAE
jgi:AAA15 family ATPase/GTPase